MKSLLDLLLDVYDQKLVAQGDQERDKRLRVLSHFVKSSNDFLRQAGFTGLRLSGGSYVGRLADGQEFSVVPEDEEPTPFNSNGAMEPTTYAGFGADTAASREAAAGIAAEKMMVSGDIGAL